MEKKINPHIKLVHLRLLYRKRSNKDELLDYCYAGSSSSAFVRSYIVISF